MIFLKNQVLRHWRKVEIDWEGQIIFPFTNFLLGICTKLQIGQYVNGHELSLFCFFDSLYRRVTKVGSVSDKYWTNITKKQQISRQFLSCLSSLGLKQWLNPDVVYLISLFSQFVKTANCKTANRIPTVFPVLSNGEVKKEKNERRFLIFVADIINCLRLGRCSYTPTKRSTNITIIIIIVTKAKMWQLDLIINKQQRKRKI